MMQRKYEKYQGFPYIMCALGRLCCFRLTPVVCNVNAKIVKSFRTICRLCWLMPIACLCFVLITPFCVLGRHSNALVGILPSEADSSISLLGENERPDVSYAVSGSILYF